MAAEGGKNARSSSRRDRAQGDALEARDLVAQSCGFFELELARVSEHLFLEPLDLAVELRGRQLIVALGGVADPRASALLRSRRVRAFHDVRDALADRARRDAVLRVELELLRATAVRLV